MVLIFKFFCLYFLILCFPLFAFSEKTNAGNCNILTSEYQLKEGKLSDYWAQELIGSDLLREELEKTPAPEMTNWLAVFDNQRSKHNIPVKNLISDEGFHAVLPELGDEIVSFFQVGSEREYKRTLSLFETDPPVTCVSQAVHLPRSPPHFINSSQDWSEGKDIYAVFYKLSPPAIVVTSSGNSVYNHGEKLDEIKTQASKNFDAIIVGSFSPKGLASDFSDFGKEVYIMAPSDEWLTSANKNGEYENFGGTSGAASLVTGSLAGFEWLSGYHPSSAEAKILLKKTAFPTLHSHEDPQINGVGLVNAYKLGEVGKRLREKCKNKNLSCFRKEILNEENYRFNVDENLVSDLNRAFPSCSLEAQPVNSLEESSCEEKGKVFKRLRRAILLNPEGSGELLYQSCLKFSIFH